MQLKHVLYIPQIDEVIDLSIRVTGQIGEDATPGRSFLESVDGYNGKELLHRPKVRDTLKG